MLHVYALTLQRLDLRGAYALLLFKNVGRMLENGSPHVAIAESIHMKSQLSETKTSPVHLSGVFCSGGKPSTSQEL
jgi:hypothetical protein